MKKSFKDTIDDIRTGFNKWRYHNEESVKQGIILPILYSLGWDIFDTRVVYPEHNMEGGRADYVLYKGNIPEILIETKSLDRTQKSSKKNENVEQVLEYAEKISGLKKVVITDGLYWTFINTDNKNKLREIKIWKDEENESNLIKLFLSANTTETWEIAESRILKREKTLFSDFEKNESNKDFSKIIRFQSFDNQFKYNDIIIHNQRGKDSKCWKETYGKICEKLYDIDSDKMKQLIVNPLFIGSNIPSFSTISRDFDNSVTIKKSELYANTYKGCNGYAKMIRELMRYFSIDAEKIILTDEQ